MRSNKLPLPSKKRWLEKTDKNNVTINILYAIKEQIYPAYVTKHNSNHEKQVFLLMTLNGEGWHCLTVKKLSALLRGIISKNNGDFYCLNCLHSFRTKPDFSHIKKYVKIKIFVTF